MRVLVYTKQFLILLALVPPWLHSWPQIYRSFCCNVGVHCRRSKLTSQGERGMDRIAGQVMLLLV